MLRAEIDLVPHRTIARLEGSQAHEIAAFTGAAKPQNPSVQPRGERQAFLLA
jgi:hypothetical protein